MKTYVQLATLSSDFLVKAGIDSISINPYVAVLSRKLVASI